MDTLDIREASATWARAARLTSPSCPTSAVSPPQPSRAKTLPTHRDSISHFLVLPSGTTGTPSTQATEDAAIAAGGLGGHDGRHHDITKKGSTGGHTGASYDVDHGLGMPHTRSMAPTDSGTSDSTTNTNVTPAQSHQQDHGSRYPVTGGGGNVEYSPNDEVKNIDRHEGEDPNVPSPKDAGYPTGKPKMMDKVKGSIMVAKAKAGAVNDEQKIHEGMMLKETGKKVNPEEEARRAGDNL